MMDCLSCRGGREMRLMCASLEIGERSMWFVIFMTSQPPQLILGVYTHKLGFLG